MELDRILNKVFLVYKNTYQALNKIHAKDRAMVFVAGNQRSGTNMFMDVMERSMLTDVYHERDSRAFLHYQMKDIQVIRRLYDSSNAPHFIIKSLCELQNLKWLMDQFYPSKTVWIYRNYNDVVNSMMRSFSGFVDQLNAIAVDVNGAGWRGRGMSKETHDIVRYFSNKGVNEESAAALQWYYRNILLFDQEFDKNPDVIVVAYENMVSDPDREFPRIFDFLNIPYTSWVSKNVYASSVRKNPPPPIDEEVIELCEGLYIGLQELSGMRPV